MSEKPILSQEKVDHIIKRIAYQILENNMEEDIALVGVDVGGRILADQIHKTLASISDKQCTCFTINLDKDHPLEKEIH